MSEGVPAGGPYRAAVRMHETLTLEHLRAAREMLSTYCRAPDYCQGYLKVLRESSALVARARAYDLPSDYKGVDRGVLEALDRLLSFYARYLAGEYVASGEHVLVEVLEAFTLRGVGYMPGEITLLPPGEAASLYSAGIVRPVESLALKIAQADGPGS